MVILVFTKRVIDGGVSGSLCCSSLAQFIMLFFRRVRFLMLWCLWLLMFVVMVMEKGGDYDSVVLCLNCGVLIW